MVTICYDYACQRNLKFGTHPDPAKSKSECIAFSQRPLCTTKLAPVILNKQKLPWAKKINHLGFMLASGSIIQDNVAAKRGQFIGKVNSIIQEYHFLSPDILMKLINVYACNFYGSCSWDLQSKEVVKL